MKQKETEPAAKIAAKLAEAEAADAGEDALHGRDARGDELPRELRRKQDRLAKIQQTRHELEAEAKLARAAELAERERPKDGPPREPPGPTLPQHRVRHDAADDPAADAQRNVTGPDSRIMKSGRDFVQGNNAQAVVDEGEQVIVSTGVTNQAPDAQHLPAMLAAVKENLGEYPVQTLGDAGYYSAYNASFCDRVGTDALLSVGREERILDPADRPTAPSDPRSAMAAKLRSVLGMGASRRRKCIVEPVFGQIKEARGIRTFLLRGLEQVRGEWNLICLAHNLLKLFRFTQRSALARA